MGAPKQKWTQEEETALKAGVVKHGAGRWRTILKDPEFSGVLYLRSNVDLKDKWRNMGVLANGWGSRDRSRLAIKRTSPLSIQEENSMDLANNDDQADEEVMDAKPLKVSGAPLLQLPSATSLNPPQRPNIRLDNLILEAITTLKEPAGSNKTTVAAYIEEKYWSPPDFKRLLSTKLKFLTANGKLIKVKRRYRVSPSLSVPSLDRRRNLAKLRLEGKQRVSIPPPVALDMPNILTKSQVDLDLAKMRTMNAQEAAIAAAQAVREAEIAIAAAEAAAKEADEAEADAEAAQAFAEAATMALRAKRNSTNGIFRSRSEFAK